MDVSCNLAVSRCARPVRFAALFLLIALIALVATACSRDSKNEPEAAVLNVIVTAQLRNGRLTVLRVGPDDRGPVSRPPREGANEPALVWELRNASDNKVAGGWIVDPTTTWSEFDAHGDPAPVWIDQPSAALIELRVPNVGGTLVIAEDAAADTTKKSFGPNLHPKGLCPIGDGGAPCPTEVSAPVPTIQGAGSYLAHSVPYTANKIVDHGPCAAINLLVVPEGFTSAQMAWFDRAADTAVQGLRSSAAYAEHWNDINVYSIHIPSKDSGISDPGCTPEPNNDCPADGSPRRILDTAFGVSFGSGSALNPRRNLSTSFLSGVTASEAEAIVADARRKLRVDVVVLVTNTTEDGGASGSPIDNMLMGRRLTISWGSISGGVLAHELGHALFELADEYDYGPCPIGFARALMHPNVSVSATHPPWESMINTTELPTSSTDPSVIGAYAGASYCETGVYRPQHTCVMRELDSQMCRVCQREMDRVFKQKKELAACACRATDDGTEAPSGGGGSSLLPGGGVQLLCGSSELTTIGAQRGWWLH